MIALSNCHGVFLAYWRFDEEKRRRIMVPEIGAVRQTDRLDFKHDIHFGMNGPEFNHYVNVSGNFLMYNLGARTLDIKNRGGRVAEYDYYFEYRVPVMLERIDKKMKGGVEPTNEDLKWVELSKRLDNFYEKKYGENALYKDEKFVGVGTRDKIKEYYQEQKKQITSYRWKRGTKIYRKADDGVMLQKVKLVGDGMKKYKKKVGGKKVDVKCFDKKYVEEMQYGAMWSKGALELALRDKNKIHFHLEGMGRIKDLLDKKGDGAYNTTARELRYVWRNWDRFMPFVKFYNGYDGIGGNAVEVQCPWANFIWKYGKGDEREQLWKWS